VNADAGTQNRGPGCGRSRTVGRARVRQAKKPLPWVATRNVSALFCSKTTNASRVRPARGRGKGPTAPGDPRKSADETPALAGNPSLSRLNPQARVELCKPEVKPDVRNASIPRSPANLGLRHSEFGRNLFGPEEPRSSTSRFFLGMIRQSTPGWRSPQDLEPCALDSLPGLSWLHGEAWQTAEARCTVRRPQRRRTAGYHRGLHQTRFSGIPGTPDTVENLAIYREVAQPCHSSVKRILGAAGIEPATS
jgi:hypothetical protein